MISFFLSAGCGRGCGRGEKERRGPNTKSQSKQNARTDENTKDQLAQRRGSEQPESQSEIAESD
jgi:hypothetical protein